MAEFNDPPWIPMARPRDIKIIGKFLEELGEAVSAGARALIQGIDGREPTTLRVNRQWLQDEVADVLGNAELIIEHFGLDPDAIRARAEEKKRRQRQWHGELR